MKKLTMIAAMVLLMTVPMMAEHVSPETAQKVAKTFLRNNGAKGEQLTDLTKAAGFANLYIFNANPGFVVMAADDRVQPILGYSFENTFVAEDMPDNVRGWLQGYSDEIQYAIDSKMKATSETTKLWKDLMDGNTKAGRTTTVVAALIQTKWNQAPGYNNLCPYSNYYNEQTVTGCVATAMAQIMKYWEFPSHGIGSHTYTHTAYTDNQGNYHDAMGELSADFGATTYEWDNMPNSLSGTSTPAQINAVATLMYHCGVSVDMDYGVGGIGGSGAVTAHVADALYTYFGYAQSTFKYKADNESTWVTMLKTELDDGRPLQYSGRGSGGHSFVCCGYDSDDKFYFNWGWSGKNDGFYALDNLAPGSGGVGGSNYVFNNNQGAIFGIQPAPIGEAAAPTLTATLVQSTGTRNVNLTWDAVSDAASYQLYYNCQLIYSGTNTSFTHVHIPYGTSTYYVRSVDASGNLSWPSNYETISITFSAPTNLTSVQSENGISLSWDATANAVSYNVYCNGILIANTTSTSHLDNRTIAGELNYYIKGIDTLGDESDASEIATVNVTYSAPIVNSLSATLTNNDAALTWTAPEWCYPSEPDATLTYGSGTYENAIGTGGLATMSWGHRYPTSTMESHVGKILYKVSFFAYEIGTYQCLIFKGTDIYLINNEEYLNPSSLLSTTTFTASSNGWFDIILNEAVVIDDTEDLWVFIYDPEFKGYPASFCSYTGTEGNYFTAGSILEYAPSHYVNDDVAWLIKTHLSDGTYTYNLYQDGAPVAENLTETTCNATLNDNAANLFTVTTNYYGGETGASNKVGFAKGTASLASLEMDDNDQMTVTEGSTLTVETLSNDNAANLVIENGAQLVNDSEDVKATVKKTIAPYTEGTRDGWNLIASPVTESLNAENDVEGLITNNYDLYAFDQSAQDEYGNAKEWRNYKANTDNFPINHKTGYLYANSDETTLSFVGTLAGATDATPLAFDNNAMFKGFNLIGNPYPCNAYINKPFYVLQYNEAEDKTSFIDGDNPIPPCAAILVEAQSGEEVVNFSKTPLDNTESSALVVRLYRSDIKSAGILDQARISFQENCQLTKYTWGEPSSMVYISKNGHDYAVAYAGDDREMPLNFTAAQNGTYTLTVESQNLELSYLHLIDNMTGDDVDLLATPNYTFTAQTTDYATRFRLVFVPNSENTVSDSEAFAYVSNGEIVIIADTGTASLQVIDVTGRVVRVCTDVARNVSTTGIPAGVYVLRLIDGENVRTQKIVIE